MTLERFIVSGSLNQEFQRAAEPEMGRGIDLRIQGKRDAVRILFVIAKAGEPVRKTAPAGSL